MANVTKNNVVVVVVVVVVYIFVVVEISDEHTAKNKGDPTKHCKRKKTKNKFEHR